MRVFFIVFFCTISFLPIVKAALVDEIENNIDKISSLEGDGYLQQIGELQLSIDSFLQKKFLVCKGELAPVILSSSVVTSASSAKIQEKDRSKCFSDYRKMNLKYIDNLHEARLKYLETAYKKRVAELSRFHEEAIEELNVRSKKEKKSGFFW